MIFGRLLLFLLSFRYLRVTKIYIYYNLLLALVWEIGLPHGMGTERISFLQTYLVTVFIFDYFDFYPTVLCITTVQLSQIVSESLLYGNEITASFIIQVLGSCVLQVLALFFIHLMITKVGMIFVETEIVRTGKD